jgi:hypothetical protein
MGAPRAGSWVLTSRRTAGLVAALILVLVLVSTAAAALAHQMNGNSWGVLVLGVGLWAGGLVVARAQPRNPIGWLLLAATAFLVLDSLASVWSVYVYRQHHSGLSLGPLAVVLQPCWAPAIVCFAVSILIFPDGVIPRGLWRPALWAFLAVALLWFGGAFGIAISAIATHAIRVDSTGNLLVIDHPAGGNAWWGYVQDAFFVAFGLSALAWLARLLASFPRAQGIHRQQLKWLIGGAATSLAAGAVLVAWGSSDAGNVVGDIGLVAFPTAITVAVMRYRLFDIDRLISRTLAYAILTGLLVGTFIGVVALTTDVLPFSGRVGVAVSTLAAAALFNPLRLRVQRLVDRRFNRARYDAEATVAAFTARLRDAVEIDAICNDLLDTINRAVAPTHASIWVKP